MNVVSENIKVKIGDNEMVAIQKMGEREIHTFYDKGGNPYKKVFYDASDFEVNVEYLNMRRARG